MARRKSLTVIFLAALLPIALLSVVLVQVSSNAVRAQAESQVETSAQASAKAIEQELEKLAEIIAIYSEQEETALSVRLGYGLWLRGILASLFEDRPDVSMAFAADAGGVVLDVLPETPDAIGVDFSFRDWFKGAQSTRAPYVSEAFQPQSDLQITMIVAAPVFSIEDPEVIAGYVGIGWSLADLQAYVDDFASSQSVLLTVTDQAGTVVASPGAAPTSIESLSHIPAIEAALEGVDSQREIDRDGVAYLSATASVDRFGWTVTADVPKSEALAERSTIVTVALVLAFVLALFVAGVIVWLGRLWRRQDTEAEQRRESEALLASIIENIPSVVTVKETKHLSFVNANRAALEMLDIERDEIIGSTIHDLAPPWMAERQQHNDREMIAGREVVIQESLPLIDEFGGRIVDVRHIPMIGPSGSVDYLLEIATDVTATQEAFHELESARADAEMANVAKSEFLSRMSHELRTPLNAVLGFGQLLEFEDLSTRQAESVQQILRGGRHLLGLINEVLDISRIESGNLSLSLEPVNLERLISETIDLIRPLAVESDLSIPVGLMPDWALWARADQQRLRQVLLNLLSNAVKYNERGGSISVRCHTVDDRRLRISVADTGSGLSQDQVDRLFSPFERLGAEGTQVEGTGLGLSLSKVLVEAMHGSIGLETALGVGTTFWIELGLSHEADLVTGARPVAVGADRVSHLARLFHVEDSLEQLRWVEELLSDHPDIELISIADAETTMDLAVRFQPDVLLLDLNVDGVDAADLVDRLSADAATSHIVVLTIGDTVTGLPGTARHLSRPISDADLVASVSDALAVARALSS